MITRLTSLLLTLCIALPMCWCCSSAGQPEEKAGCCAIEHEPEPEGKQSNCPCYNHEDNRDLAANPAITPTLVLKLLAEAIWTTAERAVYVTSVEKIPAHPEHGPPRREPPLYHRHCALLI